MKPSPTLESIRDRFTDNARACIVNSIDASEDSKTLYKILNNTMNEAIDQMNGHIAELEDDYKRKPSTKLPTKLYGNK